MRLEIDLQYGSAPEREARADGTQTLDLGTIASEARSPGMLWRHLRNQRFDVVVVHEDALPSAVQATCLLFVTVIPTDRFEVDGRLMSPARFRVHALRKAIVAIPSELTRSAGLVRSLSRDVDRSVRLPRTVAAPRSVLYLRIDPTLSWMGVQVGGAATHTSGVINGLIDNGLAVEVLAAERPVGTERATFVPVRTRRIPQLVHGLQYAAHSEEVVRAGTEHPADFVYQRYRLGAEAGLVLAEQFGVPLVLEFNGSDVWVERHWNQARMRLEGLLARLERRNLADASLVVVVSNALREIAVAEGAKPDRVLVNPNGVDIAELEQYRHGTPSEWRTRIGLVNGPTVGFIGTFGPWHGVTVLPALAQAVPNARWVIIGDGELYPQVRAEMIARKLGDRVLMPGLLERSRALSLLAACDVCVSPHLPNPDGTPFFGSPTKLFEYMGLRKPIVASDLDQISEILDHEKTALLSAPGDVEQAAAGISRLIADPDLADRLATAAFELAAKEYTWAAHVRRILGALAAGGDAAEIRRDGW
jgi:glycosyltransferase involved in cell wall biosynthesis